MDTDERFVAKTDYRKALNCRIGVSDEDSGGTVENIRSNKFIANPTVPTFDGFVIGAYEDLNSANVYYFVAGGANSIDGIYQYNPSSESIVPLVESNILSFNKHYLITGINVVGDDEDLFPQGLLYWTDDLNPPRKINIDKAINGGYTTIDAQVINAIKYPPTKHPIAVGSSNGFATDSTLSSNQLKGKSYQFKYRWIYDDGEKSTWSPISPMYIDNTFAAFYNATGQTQNNNNVIPIKFNSGHETVKRIQIASRNTNGLDDFKLIADIKKNDVTEKVAINTTLSLTSPSTTLVNGALTDNTDFDFYFYNDAIYSTIDIIESNMLYSDIPHKAKAQSIVEGNRMVYGNVVTGQTGIDNKDITLTAGQPTTSAITNTVTTVNLTDVQIQARWEAANAEGASLGTKRQTRGRFYIRWRIPPPATGCAVSYRLSVENLFFSKIIEKDGGLLTTPDEHDGNLGVINVDFNTSLYTSGMTNSNIAGNIATGLNNLAPTNIDVTDGGEILATNAWSVRSIAGVFIRGTDRLAQQNNVNGELDTNISNVSFYPTQSGANHFVTMRVDMAYGKRFYLDQSGAAQVDSSPGTSSLLSMSTGFQNPANISALHVSGRANTSATAIGVEQVGFSVGIGYDITGQEFGAGRFRAGTNNEQFDFHINDSTYLSGGDSRLTVDIEGGDNGFMSNMFLLYEGNSAIYPTLLSTFAGNRYAQICSTTTQQPTVSSFKTGAKHRFGLVYYDDGNRSSSVQLASVSDVYIPKPSDLASAPNPAGGSGEWYIDWEINHLPPSWATRYQWVYGGNTLTDDFIQCVTEGVFDGMHALKDDGSGENRSTETYADNILVDISNINQWAAANGGGVVSYDFQEGDIMRFVLDENDNNIDANTTTVVQNQIVSVPTSMEFKIVGRVGQKDMPNIIPFTDQVPRSFGNGVFGQPVTGIQDYLVLRRESALLPLLDNSELALPSLKGYTIEIYSPKKAVEEDKIIYHEFGEYGEILGGFHVAIDDTSTNTFAQNQSPNQPCKGRFTNGDVYIRNRVSTSSKLITPMESFHYTDNFKSDYWSKGRPNAVLEDFKRTRKFATCLYSEPYIPNTNINGLNLIVPDVSFQEFERSYNSIQKLHSKDNNLIIFQEDKTSICLVNKKIIYNLDGSGNIAASDSVLSKAKPYLGDYGICTNPESFANYGIRMYFVDVKRGCVIRLSQDGITVISENKMKDFFTDLSVTILKEAQIKKYKILGVFDKKYNEYIVSYDFIPNNYEIDPGQPVLAPNKLETTTIGFTERTNRWNSFYSYNPEMMVSSGVGIITFKSSQLYHHDRGVDSDGNKEYNKFYGSPTESQIWLISNEAPSNNKVYKAISTESDYIWEADIENKHGQLTSIVSSDFDTRENIHYAQVLNDINSPGGIIEGDRIRSTSAILKLSNKKHVLSRLFAANVNIFISQRSNK